MSYLSCPQTKWTQEELPYVKAGDFEGLCRIRVARGKRQATGYRQQQTENRFIVLPCGIEGTNVCCAKNCDKGHNLADLRLPGNPIEYCYNKSMLHRSLKAKS